MFILPVTVIYNSTLTNIEVHLVPFLVSETVPCSALDYSEVPRPSTHVPVN